MDWREQNQFQMTIIKEGYIFVLVDTCQSSHYDPKGRKTKGNKLREIAHQKSLPCQGFGSHLDEWATTRENLVFV